MRRAKIVCTLGPATTTTEQITRLVEAGMDIARLNMSHGDYDGHLERYERVRAAGDATGRAVGVMADLQGPKIRLGIFPETVFLERGSQFIITTEQVAGNASIGSTTHLGLPGDVQIGHDILIDDGKVAVKVLDVVGEQVITEVVTPGRVSSNKGLNLPGVPVSVPALSDKDKDDLRWALQTGVDFVALSFVRKAEDRQGVDEIMDDVGRTVPVIAKIEKPQAVDDLQGIVEAFDVIMVARGDLGVELPLEEVPLVQKQIVEAARRAGKPVIVATQVLESMVSSPRPTRAEASDAANAIWDGADALMLSGETSVGQFPTETVDTMSRIIASTEKHALDRIPALGLTPNTRSGAITLAAQQIGSWLDVKYLVTFTQSGGSARRLARLRSELPLLAFTPLPEVRSRMAMVWGVETFIAPQVSSTDDMVKYVDQTLQDLGRCEKGDLVVICAGSPWGVSGSTNAVRVHTIGTQPPAGQTS